MAPPSPPLHAKDSGSAGAEGCGTEAEPGSARPQVPTTTEGYALFLDVDGTLLEIAHHPDAVKVTAELLALLERLDKRLQGALALISGRAVADLDDLFAPLKLPAAGVHGLERRSADGDLHRSAGAEPLEILRAPLKTFAAAHPGVLIEDKQQSLALHYRAVPALAAEAEAFLVALLKEHAPSLELKHGKMVIEIKPGGADKGTAIEAFLAEPPFAGRTPIFIGDDVTDEDGFAAVNRLGGLSIRVGDGAETAAGYRLADEQSVFAWLHAWLGDPPKKDQP